MQSNHVQHIQALAQKAGQKIELQERESLREDYNPTSPLKNGTTLVVKTPAYDSSLVESIRLYCVNAVDMHNRPTGVVWEELRS